jgi:nucleoside-diphosphate-sugar epimerase
VSLTANGSLLITGAGGFIGLRCLQAALRVFERVHAVLKPGGRRPPNAPDNVTFHEVDVLNPAAASESLLKLRPERLLHLAWTTTPGRYWNAPENLDWTAASLVLLTAFANAGGRRITVAGTCAEYDWSVSGIRREADVGLRPPSLYGTCKDALRRVTEAFSARTGLSWAWGRVFFPYGAGENPRRLVSSTVRALLANRPAPCSPGLHRRDFIHVDDVASAFVALASGNADGVFNIGSGTPTAVADVVTRIGAITGRPERVRLGELPPPADEPDELFADVSRLKALGWRQQIDIDEGLRRTVEWWRSRPETEWA